ncbi:MAG: glycosyltransferase family 2 protein [candidate division WOR-3 bacterium]
MSKLPISVIILTYNEEKNIEECLKSVYGWVEEIFIVDSYSTDKTLEIAKKYTDKIYQHEFETHTKQWQWALKTLPVISDWIFGLDADQRVSIELKRELESLFSNNLTDVDGVYVSRRQIFLGRWIKYGGYYPKYLLKIFKKDKVFFDESDYVDHHFYVKGKTIILKSDIIEDNVKERDSSFWLKKHIKYAELHAMEFLMPLNKKINPSFAGSPDERTLFLKNIYQRLPLFIRPFLYFFHRYFFRLGFLDGKEGLIFHFLQGFWYRFLVDAKIYEIEKRARVENRPIQEIINEFLMSMKQERGQEKIENR